MATSISPHRKRGTHHRSMSDVARAWKSQASHVVHELIPEYAGRVRYVDCINGRVSRPTDMLGRFVFQLLMVASMVAVMSTFNGVRHSGLDFFVHSHWFYPLVLFCAFLLRVLFVNRLTDHVISAHIVPNLTGALKVVSTAALNVALMTPCMTMVVTLLLQGTDDYWAYVLATIPVNMAVAMLLNVLAVGPAVKMLYYNVVAGTERGARVLKFLQENALSWAAMLSI
ncbi:hypothetical protein HLV35_02210 [Eggerthellaceae bacterium zg-997]|nr:hypothetical protein [Eggerthellaceae bacterium zg-997]